MNNTRGKAKTVQDLPLTKHYRDEDKLVFEGEIVWQQTHPTFAEVKDWADGYGDIVDIDFYIEICRGAIASTIHDLIQRGLVFGRDGGSEPDKLKRREAAAALDTIAKDATVAMATLLEEWEPPAEIIRYSKRWLFSTITADGTDPHSQAAWARLSESRGAFHAVSGLMTATEYVDLVRERQSMAGEIAKFIQPSTRMAPLLERRNFVKRLHHALAMKLEKVATETGKRQDLRPTRTKFLKFAQGAMSGLIPRAVGAIESHVDMAKSQKVDLIRHVKKNYDMDFDALRKNVVEPIRDDLVERHDWMTSNPF